MRPESLGETLEMFRKMILALALLAGVGAPAFIAPASVAPALAQEEKADPLAGIDKQALEQVIRDYLLENPEVIVEAQAEREWQKAS